MNDKNMEFEVLSELTLKIKTTRIKLGKAEERGSIAGNCSHCKEARELAERLAKLEWLHALVLKEMSK